MPRRVFLLPMIEMAMSRGFGPAGFGPGTTSIGGCVFESSLGFSAFNRLAKDSPESAVKAIAFDAASARSEISGDLIGIYRLRVKEVRYRDKSTGNIVEQQTLVSPDFNNEPIAVWTDAGEHGTGTPQDYQRIVTRASQLAQMEGEASMFWVSPGSDTNGSRASHRAYLWNKNGDTVTAYSYSLAGSKDTLSRMMSKLAHQEDETSESLETQTIIRSGKNTQITHKEVFNDLISSFSKVERDNSQQFITQFRQEIELPDRVREQSLVSHQEKYEKELREVYKNDIKQALESIAQGFAALPVVLDTAKRATTKEALDREYSSLAEDKTNFFSSRDAVVIPPQEVLEINKTEFEEIYTHLTPICNPKGFTLKGQ